MGIFKAYEKQQSITDALRQAHAKREKKLEKLRRKTAGNKIISRNNIESFKRFLASYSFVYVFAGIMLGILVCLVFSQIAK